MHPEGTRSEDETLVEATAIAPFPAYAAPGYQFDGTKRGRPGTTLEGSQGEKCKTKFGATAPAVETPQSRLNCWTHSTSMVAVQGSPISVLNIAWYRWGSCHCSPRYCRTNAARALSVVSTSSIALF